MRDGAAFAAAGTVGVRPNGVQADDAGGDVEMADGPAKSGNCGDLVGVFGEGRLDDALQGEGAVGGPMAPMMCTMPDAASENGGVDRGLSRRGRAGWIWGAARSIIVPTPLGMLRCWLRVFGTIKDNKPCAPVHPKGLAAIELEDSGAIVPTTPIPIVRFEPPHCEVPSATALSL